MSNNNEPEQAFMKKHRQKNKKAVIQCVCVCVRAMSNATVIALEKRSVMIQQHFYTMSLIHYPHFNLFIASAVLARLCLCKL